MSARRPVREILVVELLGGFGDVLLALPAVHALAGTHAGARLTLLTFAPGDQLVRDDPLVTEVVALADHTPGAPHRGVADLLQRRRFDLVVTTTAYDGIADLCAAAAPWSVTDLWQQPPPDERVDRRFLRLLAAAGAIGPERVGTRLSVAVPPHRTAAGRAALDAVLPVGAPAPAVLVPGSGMPVKQWPAARWAELAARLGAAGTPVLTAAARGGSAVPGTVRLPAGDLRDLAATLAAVGARGGVVVGGDTGPVRLATAVGARAVGLYGPTLAGRYGLDPALGTDLQGLPECPVRRPQFPDQECWWSGRCPLTGAEPACLADLAVPAVLAAVQAQLLHMAPGTPR